MVMVLDLAKTPTAQTPIGNCKEGPVQLKNGAIVGGRWKIIRKLGEGGCGAVYKVDDLDSGCRRSAQAALKAESNFVSGGSVLKLEALKKNHMAKLVQSGKNEVYGYVVMTLFGDSLTTILKKCPHRTTCRSTQVRIAIMTLYGLKQLHDVGFVHRDLKPANLAVGRKGQGGYRFVHLLDFGLAREYVVEDRGKYNIRRPRLRPLFRGTTRYCSISSHEKQEQGRVDDLWSWIYMLVELRGPLPWASARDKYEVHKVKLATTDLELLSHSPDGFIDVTRHLHELNFFLRPDYMKLYNILQEIMTANNYRWTDLYEWEMKGSKDVSTCNSVTYTSTRDDVPLFVEDFAANPLGV